MMKVVTSAGLNEVAGLCDSHRPGLAAALAWLV
jgi:hypothetical protein